MQTESFIAGKYASLESSISSMTNKLGALGFHLTDLDDDECTDLLAAYIDQEVWIAWVQGMKYFAKNVDIRKLWEAELSSNSYYGFNLSVFDVNS